MKSPFVCTRLRQVACSTSLLALFQQELGQREFASGQQHLTIGICFNQSLDNVSLPRGLQQLTLDDFIGQGIWILRDFKNAAEAEVAYRPQCLLFS